MDKVGMRRFWDATKTFMLTRRSRETAVFLFFVLLSALFWLIQTLNGSFDLMMSYPLQLVGVPENVVITTGLPADIEVTVHDKGTSLLKYVLDSKPKPLTIIFTDHDDGSTFGHVVMTHSELLAQVSASMMASTSIVELKPDTIEYYYSRGVSRKVAVKPRGNITTDQLYYLADVACQPDTVTVWGPQEMLDTLTSIATAQLDLKALTESTSETVRLMAPKGLKVEPEMVTLTADVDMFTEKSVSVPIVGTNFPAGHTLRTFPSVVTVRFRVGAKDYKSITASNFVITATYEELMALPHNAKWKLELRSLPPGISQVRIQPEEVDFLIEISDE